MFDKFKSDKFEIKFTDKTRYYDLLLKMDEGRWLEAFGQGQEETMVVEAVNFCIRVCDEVN